MYRCPCCGGTPQRSDECLRRPAAAVERVEQQVEQWGSPLPEDVELNW